MLLRPNVAGLLLEVITTLRGNLEIRLPVVYALGFVFIAAEFLEPLLREFHASPFTIAAILACFTCDDRVSNSRIFR